MKSKSVPHSYLKLCNNRVHCRYYYQYKEHRLSTCILTIHGLLHLANDIRTCGPMWATWTFYLERFCGILQMGLRSRTHPWSNLSKRNLHMAYLGQLTVKFDLDDELCVVGNRKEAVPSCNETVYPECMCLSCHLMLTNYRSTQIQTK